MEVKTENNRSSRIKLWLAARLVSLPLLFVLIILGGGCANPSRVKVSSLGIQSVEKIFDETKIESFPSFPIEIESEDLTIRQLIEGFSKVYFTDVVLIDSESRAEQKLAGVWRDSKRFMDHMVAVLGFEIVNVEGVWIVSKDAAEKRYLEWSSGMRADEAKELVDGLGLAEQYVVLDGGVVFFAVSPAEYEPLREILKGLESGDDWVVEIAIVDSSTADVFDLSASVDAGAGGGWTVQGAQIVDRYKFTLQSGAERTQTFGSRVPYRTSVVNETGVVLTGSVEYQDLSSQISVLIHDGQGSAKAEISVQTRRPGSETDGLFEILDENIATEVFIRDHPVNVGSLKRWQSTGSVDTRYPVSQLLKQNRRRNYQIWFHAVRLARPETGIATGKEIE